MKKTPQYQIDANDRYDRANTKRLYIKLNKNTDRDILEHLDLIINKQGYVKRLIRDDIARTKDKKIKVKKI